MESMAEDLKYVIKTKDGPVCGYIDKKGDRTCYKFKSIPYAKPPVGNLRFLPPYPTVPWTETIDGTKSSPTPMSVNIITNKINGSEDCLYIEISTPNITPKEPLPVMFWIGCFAFAISGDELFDASSLIKDQEVMFIRCGFRMGPFGFLSINNFIAPGNCGLKDIVMALKWVQRNIAEFGGDPNKVTIFGSSAGGAIVHLLMLSPMASGLFHRAIIQSASALNNWSLAKNPFQPVMELAKLLGITKTCKMDIIDELKTISAVRIMEAFCELDKQSTELNKGNYIDSIFKPCIEQDFEGQPAFLTRSPPAIIKSGSFNKVPLIIGSNYIEASILLHVKKHDFYEFEKFNNNPELIVPRSLAGESNASKRIAQQLLNFYLDGEKFFRKDTRTQYIQMMSDYYFLYYLHKTVQMHIDSAPDSPVYYYVVNHPGEWYVPEELQFFNTLGHCVELPYIFGLNNYENNDIYKGSRDSVKTRKKVVKMWTNFAKYGNPIPDEDDPLLQIKWDPVENKDKLNYLSIGAELTKGRNPFQERMEFWEELHKEYMFLRVLVHFNDMGVTY